MILRSKKTLLSAMAGILAVILIQPATAGSIRVPDRLSWVRGAEDPAAVMSAITAHGAKLPPEFAERLKHVFDDGTIRVMVALDSRDVAIESFVERNTMWLQWYGDGPRFLGRVTPDQLGSLLESSAVDFIEPDYRISNFMSTSTLDVHARSLNSGGTGVWSFDPAGGPHGALRSDVPGLSVDQATGKGVTVAITDSGIDKTFRDFGGWDCEADFYSACESRIVKAVSTEHLIGPGADPSGDLPTTELASGHGTHVAGTVAGNAYYTRFGAPDVTRYKGDGHNFGIAPQANLVSLKNGDTIWAGLSQQGLQWTLDHAEEYGIRVSSNSWGCLTGCSFNGNSVAAQLYKDLYEAGVVVTFAAGNGGGGPDGAAFSGNAQSPYVLGVANYNDDAAGHPLASSSSRGVGSTTLAPPETWTPESEGVNGVRRPDVAAPGTSIWSAGSLTGGAASVVPRVSPEDGGPVGATVPYRSMSGTSMATPHVSGAAALLFSACPEATALDVMRAVMAGADPADVRSTDGTRQALPYEAGYGALEIRASLDWLLSQPACGGSGTTPTPTESPTTSPTPTESPTGDPTDPGARGVYPVSPNDPYFPDSTDPFEPQQWAPQLIQAPQAWQEDQATGYGVHVAILDSGLALGHEDFQCPGKVVAGQDFIGDGNGVEDGAGHGTHVAGIIGACTNNDTGIAGVAPDSTLMPYQVLDADGSGDLLKAAEAVKAATDDGAHVINMSLGSILGPASGIPGALDFMDEAIAYANSHGVVVVAAAGNDSAPICEYPSSVDGVLCVGATDNRDLKSWYSVFPNKANGEPAVVAPGGNEVVFCDVTSEAIFSTYPAALDGCNEGGAGYRNLNGTSMASPHVAGVAALVYDRLGAARSDANRQKVIDAIVSSAVDLGAPGYDPLFGDGRVDALGAVRAVDPVVVEPPAPAVTATDFTADSATGGQYSDQATVAARVTDTTTGGGIGGAEVIFELTGDAVTESWTAQADGSGLATKTIDLSQASGSYVLTARYAGEGDVYAASADVTGFVIDKEGSDTDLTVAGSTSKRAFSAKTTEVDAGGGLAGVVVEFFRNGVSVGTATTNADGVAVLQSPPKFEKKVLYEAVFAGDGYYAASSDAYQEK